MLSVVASLIFGVTTPSALETSQTKFGLKCLVSLASRPDSGNICISPFSLQSAGILLRLGSSGSTNTELGQILEHDKSSTVAMADQQKKVGAQSKSLLDRGGLLVANGLWSRGPLKPAYVRLATDIFHAAAVRTTFPEPGLTQINSWVKKNTKNRIPDIFKRLDRETEFVLANAVWFKDNWIKAFDPKNTQPASFQLSSGESIKVPSMFSRLEFLTTEVKGMRICAIPMKNSVLLIGLPQGSVSEALSNPAWERALLGQLPMATVRDGVRLPKFELESNVDLLALMKTLGMRVASDPRKADFSAMTSSRVFISQARHRTFFKIDEEGAEAAAVTAISNSRGSSSTALVVDRPFLFAIKADNTVLFSGIVKDPRQP